MGLTNTISGSLVTAFPASPGLRMQAKAVNRAPTRPELAPIGPTDLAVAELRRLVKEFETEQEILKGRVDGLEAQVENLNRERRIAMREWEKLGWPDGTSKASTPSLEQLTTVMSALLDQRAESIWATK